MLLSIFHCFHPLDLFRLATIPAEVKVEANTLHTTQQLLFVSLYVLSKYIFFLKPYQSKIFMIF